MFKSVELSRLASLALATISLILAYPTAAAEDPDGTTNDEVSSEASAETEEEALPKLIYSVNRTPEVPFGTARAVQVITRDEIWRRNARTLPEVLMEEAGIFVQQTNYGGGAPFIRGLKGKQILILIDGVKINNATYRFGPVQYLATIDLAWVERIEIVRGVGSVLGSDALGGTINIITRKGPGLDEDEGVGGSAFARYSTADQSITGTVQVSNATDKIRYHVGATYRDSDDLEGGGDVGKQIATGYDETAVSLSLDYFVTPEKTLSFSYHQLQQNDVPRTDRVAGGTNLVFDFDPQRLSLTKVAFQDLTSRSWSDTFQVVVSWNDQEEGRREIRASSPGTERRLLDDQQVLGLNVEVSKSVGSSHRLTYGLDYFTEDIESTRVDLNLSSGASSSRRGQFTDGASYETLAAYLQDRWNLGKWVTLTLGGRFNSFSADGDENSSVGRLDLKSSDKDFTGSINLVVHATEQLNLIANATRGFRAPNIDDLSVFDERSDGTEVPNTDLTSEEITTFEVGAKVSSPRFSGSVFYYTSDLSDLIVRTAGTFNGLPFFDLDGDGVKDPDEPAVLQRQNIGKASIDGFEVDFELVLRPTLKTFGNFTTTTGDDDLDGVPLSRIPPDFGTLGIRWAPKRANKPWIEGVFFFASAQGRLSPEDVSDSRIGPGGTDGFEAFHLRGGLDLGESFRLSLALENLTDEKYKYHSSGVFRPGFQAVVGAEWRF